MLHEAEFPILEFDDDPAAVVDVSIFSRDPFSTDKMVITFFPEVVEKLLSEGAIRLERTIPGENPLPIYFFTEDPSVLISLGQVGCAACGGNLDAMWGAGIRKVMFCGGGGVLDSEIHAGQLLLVDGAIRDEGFSYHYIAPSRYIYTDTRLTDRIAARLDELHVPYLRGLVWTTDAMFRETRERIARRKAEGAKIVEMEQSGCIAVARFRDMAYGALIYGGDDVSREEWDDRDWRSQNGLRYDLVHLCRTLVKEM